MKFLVTCEVEGLDALQRVCLALEEMGATDISHHEPGESVNEPETRDEPGELWIMRSINDEGPAPRSELLDKWTNSGRKRNSFHGAAWWLKQHGYTNQSSSTGIIILTLAGKRELDSRLSRAVRVAT
jgi:hypothetical protein